MSGDYSGASERLSVHVDTPMRDFVAVRTSFNVKRWDAEQTDWAARNLRKFRERPPWWEPQGSHFAQLGVAPYSETQDDDCNLVVQNGWVSLLGGIAGTTIAAKYSATNGRIGVGTSATAAAYAQTYLQGDTGSASTTSYYQLCGVAPTIVTATTPPTLTFTATFATGVANFAWAEFGTDNGSASGVYLNGLAGGFVLLNRGVSAQGTKVSGQTWTATEIITFGYPSGAGTLT
jgi:hypothetical protein